ncbi:MAG: hypothetical protein AAF585_02480, partial [Verrucomicrobiota bacterium]
MNERAECHSWARRFAFRWGRERRRFQLTRPRVKAALGPYAPESVKVALLSDFHYDPLREAEHIRLAVEMVNAESPDLALL